MLATRTALHTPLYLPTGRLSPREAELPLTESMPWVRGFIFTVLDVGTQKVSTFGAFLFLNL